MNGYTLKGNDMLHAPGLIAFAQRAFRSGQQETARRIVESWPGLPSDVVERIVRNKEVQIETSGDDAVVTLVESELTSQQWSGRAYGGSHVPGSLDDKLGDE